jgi:hypothetical protein
VNGGGSGRDRSGSSTWSGYGVHFIGNLLRQSALIQIEVTPPIYIGKPCFPAQVVDCLLEQPPGFIEVEGVCGPHGEMDLSLEQGAYRLPILLGRAIQAGCQRRIH